MIRIKPRMLAVSTAVTALLAGAGVASAAAVSPPHAAAPHARANTAALERLVAASGKQPAGPVYVCLTSAGQPAWFEMSQPGHRCAFGLNLWHWNITGPQGPKGDRGPAGPSGVISANSTDLGAVTSVPTGGSFVTGATKIGTIELAAGTYEVNLSAKATPPAGGTGSVEVFPQFFVYNQPANAGFTGDLFNVGSGALESGANSQIDSYYSGYAKITLTQDTTLYVYAFGYDSDRGAGKYTFDSGTFTATRIQPSGS